MKVFVLCLLVSVCVVGRAALLDNKSMPDTQVLNEQYRNLSEHLRQTLKHEPAKPIEHHWARTKLFVEAYDAVKFIAVPKAKVNESRPHKVWVGDMVGPVLPVLLIAMRVQDIAPVYLERIAVKQGHAKVRLQVWGS